MTHEYRVVDVFSDAPFLGNPVAVVLDAEGLSTDRMQAITRWTNLSETTFLLPPTTEEADYRVRIFTLDRELPFAGHPTLGSAAAWLSAGNRPKLDDRVVQECEAGLIDIRLGDSGSAFAAPPLLRYEAPAAAKIEEVSGFLGIEESAIADARWVDNGPGWLGVRLQSADAVRALRPSARHDGRIEVGVVGPTDKQADYDFEVRAFFSDANGNVLEDPVTGSLNAALAYWLIDTGVTQPPFTCGQGSALGRQGRISVTRDAAKLWIGGATCVRIEGRIDAD